MSIIAIKKGSRTLTFYVVMVYNTGDHRRHNNKQIVYVQQSLALWLLVICNNGERYYIKHGSSVLIFFGSSEHCYVKDGGLHAPAHRRLC